MHVSVGGQAELLRGLTLMAYQLRDWQRTKYDRHLGSTNLADYISDLPKEAVDQQLFPKDLMFAATLGSAANIMQNLTKASSAVALIGVDGKLQWFSESASQQTALAVIFDVVDGKRATETKVADVARFLSSVVEFLKMSEQALNTRAAILRERDAQGVRPVDQLREAQGDLKLLVMALANFLSSETIGADGLVRPLYSYDAKTETVSGASGVPDIHDQTVVIRALLDAADTVSANIYRTSAIDLFSAMNARFYRPELGFYTRSEDSKELDLAAVSSVLVAGERLAPYLAKERATEWSAVSKPWLNALRDAAEKLP
jgi:hypothetical protein